ncbi:ABC transporter permease, partial [Caldibacillus debilis]
MNNFWVVFTHTFVTKIKSKQFLWVTAITVGITLLLVYLPSLIDKFNGDGEKKIALIDQTGQLEEAFKQSAANLDKNLKFTETAAEEQELKEKVLEGELDGYLLLSFDEAGLPRGVFKAETLTDQSLAGNLQMALQQVRSQRAAQLLNLNAEQLAMLNAPADFRQAAIGENAKTEEELNQARGLVYS